MNTPKTRRSEAVENGRASRMMGLNLAQAGEGVATRAVAIIRDILDNDGNYDTAILAANELSEMGVHISMTGWNVADGNIGEAKHASDKLTGK